jgi:phosphoenolpyruvate phosphomutase
MPDLTQQSTQRTKDMSKSTRLKNIINKSYLDFIMEAHNGLSAKVVEESRFKGIWASGLTLSASLGVRDNNEASWSQILDVLEFMSDVTTIPILFDGDTGFGNFNNARILVRKLEQREIAGVCIEDKQFPKTNSFLGSDRQLLADVDEFCGKIKAMKDVQKNDDFIVVARVEAFIAGWGLDEALRRAEAYRKAGADAILIHSKRTDFTEIELFMKEWGQRLPVVIVPTKYYSVPTARFRDTGISLVIWANQTMRSALTAMQKTVRQIFQDESLINVESKIAPISELFRLQGATELEEAEKKYLPASGKNVNTIILAAAQGDLGELTRDIPKALLKIGGTPILTTQIQGFNSVGINDITVVRGFAKDKIKSDLFKTIDNDDYASTTELSSLALARNEIRGETVICYGDLVFKNFILNELLNDMNDITVIVDADYEKNEKYHEYVRTDVHHSRKLFAAAVRMISIHTNPDDPVIHGEFIGLFKVNETGAEVLKTAIDLLSKRDDFRHLRMKDLFAEIIRIHAVAVKFIKGSWLDINTLVDLQKAGDF